MKFAKLGRPEWMVGYRQGESIGAQKVVGEGHDKQRIGMRRCPGEIFAAGESPVGKLKHRDSIVK